MSNFSDLFGGNEAAGLNGLPAQGYKSGEYYCPSPLLRATANSAATDTLAGFTNNNIFTDILNLTPIFISKAATFDRLGIQQTSAAAGVKVRIGIYNVSGGCPTTRVIDAGFVTGVSGAGLLEVTTSVTLSRGWYAFAALAEANMQVQRFVLNAQAQAGFSVSDFAVVAGSANNFGKFGYSQAYGSSLPSAVPGNPSSSALPVPYMRAA